MSRTDQFVGLNKSADDFIQYILDEYNTSDDLYPQWYKMIEDNDTLCGVGNSGIIIDIPLYNDLVNKKYTFKEVVQCVNWSSGPIYFTHLKMYMYKKSGQIIDMGEYYSWIQSPEGFINEDMFKQEYNYEKGIIYL